MQDKKNFISGVLDENSKYYKEYIEKYEVNCNFGFVKGKISPYKSSCQFGLEVFGVGVKLSSMTHHIRNATTYDGGIKLGGSIEGVSIKGSFGFTATIGSNGKISPDDFDIRAGIEGGTNLGYVNIKAGVEASALRGTKEYVQLVLTGNPILTKLKKDQQAKEMLKGLPSITKPIWKGEYKEQP